MLNNTRDFRKALDYHLVCLGTGTNQLPLIRAAKALGNKVTGIDQFPNKQAVDNAIEVSIYDPVALREPLLALHATQPIDALIFRSSGPAILTAFEIEQLLGLNTLSKQVAEISTSKYALSIDSGGFLSPITQRVNRTPPSFELPYIVKPDSPLVGKKNVYKIEDTSEFEPAFENSQDESTNGYVVVQQFIRGIDVGVMCWVQAGELIWCFFYEEVNNWTNTGLQACGVRSTEAPEISMSRLQEAITNWQFTVGVLFLSFRYCKETKEACLYEVNPGLCGDDICDQLLPKCFPNFDVFSSYVRLMLNQTGDFPSKDQES